MAHIGIISHPLVGHLNPTIALAGELRRRGHRVTFFGIAEAGPWVTRRGLDYVGLGTGRPVGLHEEIAALARYGGPRALLRWQQYHSRLSTILCEDGPAAIDASGADLLLVDQVEPAGQAIAEHLGLPFVTLCCAMALNRDPRHPPIFTGWGYAGGSLARARNNLITRAGDLAAARTTRPVAVYRRRWGLRHLPLPDSYYAQSSLAVISQQTPSLDFPRAELPPWFHYVGPLRDPPSHDDAFPWEQLEGEPFGYASLGTSQCRREEIFQRIAVACADLGLRLVIAHGGGLDEPAVRRLPGRVVAVTYAPQIELLARADVTIAHGGLNTVLDSLYHGVPMVLIPLAFEQPAMAARVRHAGAAAVLRPGRLGGRLLRETIAEVRGGGAHRAAARALMRELRGGGGAPAAAAIVEGALAAVGAPVPA